MNVVNELIKDIKIPRMAKVKQIFSRQKVENIEETLRFELLRDDIKRTIKPGTSIAITAGSRGITNMAYITKQLVSFVKEQGANPFIIPAMGSHGGATADGQLEVLKSYGITEEYCGCPIKATMETKQIGFTRENQPVFIDKYAAEADGIIIVNRIKAHTCFRGPYESGLMKMMTIGLGKQKGADVCHEAGFKHMAKFVPLFANAILENANILFGVATIENSFHDTAKIIALTKKEIPLKEPELLKESMELMPKIFFNNIDVLIVDKIGKNFSGSGMDPNISGTFCTPYACGGINAQRVAVLDLSDETHGNAVGMGSADFTTRRLFEKIDFQKTYPNVITSTVVNNVKIPMIMESDKNAIQVAIKTCTEIDKNNPLIIRIPNTLEIEYIYISEGLYDLASKMDNIEILEEPKLIEFNSSGNLW